MELEVYCEERNVCWEAIMTIILEQNLNPEMTIKRELRKY
jgi:hypothetical protein